jgi:hypothetical protein
MGHSYVDMFPRGKDKTFGFRYAKHKKRCLREISDIIEKNPITFEEITIGDDLTLYAPLKGLSKIRFDDEGEFELIQRRFGRMGGLFEMHMWELGDNHDFVVYDKDGRRKEYPLVRIDKPSTKFVQWNPSWIYIKYFEKKK